MKSFKHFFEATKPLGLIETLHFQDLGPIEAKVDSGNGAYNVLHGQNIQEVEAVQALVNNGDIDPEKAHEKFATSFQNIFE